MMKEAWKMQMTSGMLCRPAGCKLISHSALGDHLETQQKMVCIYLKYVIYRN